MALSIQESLREDGRRPAQPEGREARFERFPWLDVTHTERQNPPVTVWTGVKVIVIAIPHPDDDPEEMQISITGTRLQIKGTAQSTFVNRDIELPYPVYSRPIRIEDGKGTLYILLQKK